MANEKEDNLEEMSSRLARQQEALDKLNKDYSSITTEWLKSSAKSEAINQGRDIETRIRKESETSLKKFRFWSTIVGVVIAATGAASLPIYIERVIDASFKENIEDHLTKVKEDINKKATRLIEQSQAVANLANSSKFSNFKNQLIVLQTDYGSESPDMGMLKGAIYRYNPYARIDTITDQIEAFDVFDAAWTLRKAVKYYPKDTIFLSITGDFSKNSSPIILRDESSGHTFIGYKNGAFDLIADSKDKIYTIELHNFKDELKEWLIDKQLGKDNKTDKWPNHPSEESSKYLGFIAGMLSRTPTPWEVNYKKENNYVEEENTKRFSWENVWKETQYNASGTSAVLDKIVLISKEREDKSVLIKGTIMSIDRFGNANTNITKSFFLDALEKKGLKLDSSSKISVGISCKFNTYRTDDNKNAIKLKTVKFSENYSEIKEKIPLITIASGRLQLAINLGNLSTSNILVVEGDLNDCRKKDKSRHVDPTMEVLIHVVKLDDAEIILDDAEISGTI